jgi:hypothetical protein
MQVMIRYRLKPEHVDRDRRMLDAVFDELDALAPEGVSYVTFVLDDGLSHVAIVETDGPGRFSQLPAFRHYRAGLDERCEEPPVVTELTQIGQYAGPTA